MTDERLRRLVPSFKTPEFLHLVVQRQPAVHGAGVRKASGALPRLHAGDIHKVRGPEVLRLSPRLNLVIDERYSFAASEPKITAKQGTRAMVAVRVDLFEPRSASSQDDFVDYCCFAALSGPTTRIGTLRRALMASNPSPLRA